MRSILRLILLNLMILSFSIISAQEHVSQKAGLAIITQNALLYPKFYKVFNNLRNNDKKVKDFIFVRGNGYGNPAAANSKGIIMLDISFIENQNPNFDDNRLVVVLYHELGHLYYFENNKNSYDSEESEKYAFEFSLKKTKDMADMGDCMPLKTGLKFMYLRSTSDNLEDPHVRALKKMVNQYLYKDLYSFSKNCTD